MRIIARLIRIYTPFTCTLMALLNGVYFMNGEAQGDFVYITSALTGNSIAVVVYMFATSLRMCVWYKLNLLCLLLIQILGLTYDYMGIEFSEYLLLVVLLAALGIICFLIFRVTWHITSICRHLRES